MSMNVASGVTTYQNALSLMLASRLTSVRGFIANRLLPIVPVLAREDKFYKIDPGPMMVAPDTNRAEGGNYGEITFSARQSDYRCKSRGLRVKIPVEQIKEHNRLALKEMGTYITAMQMMNATEKRVCDLVFNRTTWPASGTTGHDCSNEWDDHANATPCDEILTAKQNLVANIGALAMDGNIVAAMSWRTAHHAMLCDQIRDKIGIKYKDNVPPDAVLTEGLLAAALGVDEVVVAGGQYKSGGTDAAPTGTNFVSDELCMVFRRATFQNDTGVDIPAKEPVVCGLGASFLWNEMGDQYEVYDYEDPDTKSEKTRVDQYTDEQILVTGAGYLIGNCYTG